MMQINPIAFLFDFKSGIPSFMGMRIGDKYDAELIEYLKEVSGTGNVAINDYSYGHIIAKYSPIIEVEASSYIICIKCFVDIPEIEREYLYGVLASGLDHQYYFKNIENEARKPLFCVSNELYRIAYEEDINESGEASLCLSLGAVYNNENNYYDDMPVYRMINKAIDGKNDKLRFDYPVDDIEDNEAKNEEYEKHREVIKRTMFELTKDFVERGDMMEELLDRCPESVVAVFGDDVYDANIALYDFYDCESWEDEVTGETNSYDGWLEYFSDEDGKTVQLYDLCCELYHENKKQSTKLAEIKNILN